MTKRDKLHARLAEAKQARMKEQDLGHLSWGETPVDAERIELTSRTIPETSHSSGGWLKNAFGKLQDSLSGRPKEMSPDEWRELKSKGQDKTYVDAKAREQEGENARTARLAAEAEQFADLSRLGQLGDPSAMKPYPAKRGNDVSGDSGVLEEDGWDEAPVSSPEQEGPQVTGHIGTSGSENSGTDEQSGGTGYLPSTLRHLKKILQSLRPRRPSRRDLRVLQLARPNRLDLSRSERRCKPAWCRLLRGERRSSRFRQNHPLAPSPRK